MIIDYFGWVKCLCLIIILNDCLFWLFIINVHFWWVKNIVVSLLSLPINTVVSLSLSINLSSSFSLTAPSILKTSNPHNFLVSYPNYFKQSENFIFFSSLQTPLNKIFRNRPKWQNLLRREKAQPPPPPLPDNIATTLPVTHQCNILKRIVIYK